MCNTPVGEIGHGIGGGVSPMSSRKRKKPFLVNSRKIKKAVPQKSAKAKKAKKLQKWQNGEHAKIQLQNINILYLYNTLFSRILSYNFLLCNFLSFFFLTKWRKKYGTIRMRSMAGGRRFMSKYHDCCANCLNLEVWNYPSFHYWCSKNEDCPCNGDETPSFTFSCEKYVRDIESLYAD